MRVELIVFSGRPNPEWMLSSEQADHVYDMLMRLSATSPVELPNILGYRGLRISDPKMHYRADVFNGMVTLKFYANRNVEHRADPDRALEQLLLSTAPDSISRNLLGLRPGPAAGPGLRPAQGEP